MGFSTIYHSFDENGNYLGARTLSGSKAQASSKVSVIIPIYNTAQYLDQALSSVTSQTYDNLEIICINDGSTDESLSIIKRHAAADDRIIVIDKQNEGYGASCNRGLEVATGEWVAILEPDDWIEPDMFKDMLKFASGFEGVDIIKTPYTNVLPTPHGDKMSNCCYRNLVKPKKQPFKIADEVELIRNHPSIWSALYRKGFLDEKGIKFMPIPGAGWADNPFLIETMCQAESIIWLNETYYNYRNDTKEKVADFHRKNYRIPFERWDEMLDIIERLGITDERILMAHYNRGFVYMAGVIEFNDVNDPEIIDLLKRMFARMDADIVLNSDTVSPGAKRLFAEMRGLPTPKTSKLSYARKLVKSTFTNLQNAGPMETALQVGNYLKTHSKRTGGR